ncbi:MAG: class I SAM-dependent methyltransferase [Gammaproteobacteria bacterium]|nr:class I SAM-dependent methyltransferase [Gammaproteobacteria bacterium]
MTESPGTLTIRTDLDRERLVERLRKWQPWRHEICFSNGVKTSDLETTTPFTRTPLNKINVLEAHLPMSSLSGGTALDIGFNAGYNSVYLASRYGMRVTGVDVWERHKEVAEFLAGQASCKSTEFLLRDATTFLRPDYFDLILHFGTLYHLPNPLLSLENCARSLRKGGYLGLETTCYLGSDPTLCKFVWGFNGDRTNFWALSKPVLESVLRYYGLGEICLLKEARMEIYKGEMSRVLYAARKI